ncbi:pilus biosynthesis protein PilZ [Candidatus Magnetoovum chiemensis]|nr:pilus biosynthesis protein PilZ [Candidatus Magnetoovum chiemensis]
MLEVGNTISIHLQRNNTYVGTPIVGWEKGHYIITKIPYIKPSSAEPARPINLEKSNKYIMRFIKDGVAYGFESEVLTVQFYPAPLCFFVYPAVFESMKVRKHKRIKTSIPSKIVPYERDDLLDAQIVDFSETGCLVKTVFEEKRRVNIEDIFYLTFQLIDTSFEEIECFVMNHYIHPDENSHLIGLRFNSLESKTLKKFRAFLSLIDQ